jgi:hypothetical protein
MKIDLDKVPVNIDESIEMFINTLTTTEKAEFSKVREDEVSLFHHTWGTVLRNEWSLWENETILPKEFRKIGISHADDMSGIILTSAYRKLNKKPIKIKEQVAKYQSHWEKEIGKPIPD